MSVPGLGYARQTLTSSVFLDRWFTLAVLHFIHLRSEIIIALNSKCLSFIQALVFYRVLLGDSFRFSLGFLPVL